MNVLLTGRVLVLSDRERRSLARIERHLVGSDPELARLFAGQPRTVAARPGSTFLLATGLLLLVFGSIAAVPVAVLGMAVSLVGLFTAYARPSGRTRPSPA